MNYHPSTSLVGNYAVRHDTPWQRLPWTGPLAAAVWSSAIFMLAHFVNTPSSIPPEAARIDARFVELPPPLKPVPAPAVIAAPPQTRQQSKPQPAKHPQRRAEPAAAPQPAAKQTSAPASPDNPQPAPALAQNTAQGTSAASTQSPGAPQAAAHGLNVLAGAIGVVEPQHTLDSPATGNYAPPDASVYSEEAPVFGDGSPPLFGMWHQEYTGTCDPVYTWDQSCNMASFSQPNAPWCYNDDPIHPWNKGTCDEEFAQAIAAYKHKDYASAFAQFKKLAENEFYPAESDLAAMYTDGIGVEKDMQQALFWWRKAAKENDPKAVYNMALIYSDGKGVPKDDKQAFYWYRKAAYFGYDFAQYNLAVMYALGKGIDKDDKQAAIWYRKSALRGNPDAEYNLGTMYAHGIGVPKDDKQVVYWYCKAMTRGNQNAMAALASMYAPGADKPDYHELAYSCWLFALPTRWNAATAELERDTIEQPLTQEQRARAQTTARLWLSK